MRKLCSLGLHVRVLIRDQVKHDIFNSLNVELVRGDIANPTVVEKAVEGVEQVFHIAAVFRTAGLPEKVYRDVHVKGTEHLLNMSLKYSVKRFVHCSTVGVHGHIEKSPANESYRFKPGDVYQKTKLEGEQKALQFGRETGLPVTIIRPCAIYGPGDMRLLKLFRMASKKVVFLLGSGENLYHMVYIDDLINALLMVSENDKAIGETFIIGGEESLSLNKLIDLIAQVQNIRNVKIHLPVKPFQLLGSVCESICLPLKLKPPIYRRRVDFFTKSRSFDISKALKILKFEPKVDIIQGITNSISWYREQNIL